MKQMSYMINQRYMKKLTCCFVCIFLLIGTVAAQDKEVKLKIVQTSDIHGNFYTVISFSNGMPSEVWHACTLSCRKSVRRIRTI